jgi:hypothetical protein
MGSFHGVYQSMATSQRRCATLPDHFMVIRGARRVQEVATEIGLKNAEEIGSSRFGRCHGTELQTPICR